MRRGILLLRIGIMVMGCGSDGRSQAEVRATAEQGAAALAQGDSDAAKARCATPWGIAGWMTNRIRSHGEPQSATVGNITVMDGWAAFGTVWEVERATVQHVWEVEIHDEEWRLTGPSMNPNERVITTKGGEDARNRTVPAADRDRDRDRGCGTEGGGGYHGMDGVRPDGGNPDRSEFGGSGSSAPVGGD